MGLWGWLWNVYYITAKLVQLLVSIKCKENSLSYVMIYMIIMFLTGVCICSLNALKIVERYITKRPCRKRPTNLSKKMTSCNTALSSIWGLPTITFTQLSHWPYHYIKNRTWNKWRDMACAPKYIFKGSWKYKWAVKHCQRIWGKFGISQAACVPLTENMLQLNVQIMQAPHFIIIRTFTA